MRAKHIHESVNFTRTGDSKTSLDVGLFGDMSPSRQRFVNGIRTTYFGWHEVEDPKIDIDEAGWYWADKDDNWRYSDWTGPFDSATAAAKAGKAERAYISRNWS